MAERTSLAQEGEGFRAILHPHRSLGRRGFIILMSSLALVSFIVGTAFMLQGAWPVFGFFGLDVLAVYLAFQLNYRAGRRHELVELTPSLLAVTRVEPSGERRRFEFNPYWVRVLFSEAIDGRTTLRLQSHGEEFEFGRFLTDDERRDFADALKGALAIARTTAAIQ
ncbi:MAG: DUF2244 domain-containing protein [Hyphomicrobium sp.]